MGPHSRQYSIQQSTNIICNGSALLNLEKTSIITINMTIDARRIDDNVRRKRNDDETMGTVRPAGRIRRRRRHFARLICVGDEGRQGGASGGRVGGVFGTLLMVELGSPVFFHNAMCVFARIITPPKSMVHPPCKICVD